jgi:catechol 2,3-dioxygenase-like lactoylglutathione lyase family enzyme
VTRFRGMRHVALKVNDVETSARFYQAVFGMRRFGPPKHDGHFIALVSPGLKDQISLSEASDSEETGRSLGQPGQHGGIDHFGFVLSPVGSLDAVRRRVESAGGRFLRRHDIDRRVPSMFFTDPDGYVFQVTRFPWLTKIFVAALPLMGHRPRRGAVSAPTSS